MDRRRAGDLDRRRPRDGLRDRRAIALDFGRRARAAGGLAGPHRGLPLGGRNGAARAPRLCERVGGVPGRGRRASVARVSHRSVVLEYTHDEFPFDARGYFESKVIILSVEGTDAHTDTWLLGLRAHHDSGSVRAGATLYAGKRSRKGQRAHVVYTQGEYDIGEKDDALFAYGFGVRLAGAAARPSPRSVPRGPWPVVRGRTGGASDSRRRLDPMRSTIRALLIVTALLIATSSPSHAKSTRRVLASAGPSFVSTKDGALNTGLDVGTGFEVGDPVARWSLRLDLHGVRQDHTSWHAMTGLACVRVMLAPSDAAVRPYLWGGAGYGSALAYSGFHSAGRGRCGCRHRDRETGRHHLVFSRSGPRGRRRAR